MAENIHVGDIGTVFEITIVDDNDAAIDISTATTLQIIFKKPNNRGTLTKTATFTNSGTDGKLEYATISGDLDTAGLWYIQGKVVEATYTNSSEIDSFLVEANN